MKKNLAIELLGGNNARAAQHLGVTKQAVQAMPTDAEGNLISRRHTDAVLAALVRKNYRHREAAQHQGERIELDEATLADLVALPEDEDNPEPQREAPRRRKRDPEEDSEHEHA